MKRKPPVITNPCSDCPFRADGQGVICLGQDRATEIADSLTKGNGSVFPCHKTLDYEEEEDKRQDWATRTIPCAGACVTTHKELGEFNGMMQVGQRLRIFDLTQLNHDAPVYQNMAEFIKAQSEI